MSSNNLLSKFHVMDRRSKWWCQSVKQIMVFCLFLQQQTDSFFIQIRYAMINARWDKYASPLWRSVAASDKWRDRQTDRQTEEHKKHGCRRVYVELNKTKMKFVFFVSTFWLLLYKRPCKWRKKIKVVKNKIGHYHYWCALNIS